MYNKIEIIKIVLLSIALALAVIGLILLAYIGLMHIPCGGC